MQLWLSNREKAFFSFTTKSPQTIWKWIEEDSTLTIRCASFVEVLLAEQSFIAFYWTLIFSQLVSDKMTFPELWKHDAYPSEVWSIVDHSYLPKRTAFLFLDFAAPFYVTVLVKRGNLCISGELSFSNKGSRRSPTTWVMVTNGLSTDAIRNPGAQSTWSSLGVALSCALIGNRSPSLECLEDPPRWNGCLPPR